MLNGLDLFSGIGGLTISLSDWVKPVAYCEIERFASAVLLSRMSEGKLPIAPIWDDVTTLRGSDLPEIDIIYGGFPCQDVSVAGRGKGLAGERSGLFYEIVRLAKEIKPTFIFLENVPAITSRGGVEVVNQITEMGYDCRWTCLSAAEVGANHKRERWWLLGYAKHYGSLAPEERGSSEETILNDSQGQNQASESKGANSSSVLSESIVPDSTSLGSQEQGQSNQSKCSKTNQARQANWANCNSWWSTEPDVGRVANGIPFRVDRLKGLGNAVVPVQAKTAFEILSGVKK